MDKIRAAKVHAELLGKEIGGWLVTALINSGKSAVVFRATKNQKEAALKVFDTELVEKYGKDVQQERINRELQLRGKKHPHLVEILDGGCCPVTGYLFVVMEYLPNPNLADVLTQVPPDRIGSIISQIAQAAEFLESLNLVHRDIKPENIAISTDFQRATLLDLGVIRPIGLAEITDGTEQKPFIGTLQYSSPEYLLRLEKKTPEGYRALTFYQLGAVLHDLLTKRRLFEEHLVAFARLVLAVYSQEVQIVADDKPPRLVMLANNCLIKDPSARIKLVSWKDFHPEPEAVSPAVGAKLRILQRISAKQLASPQDGDEEMKRRVVRRLLTDIYSQLEAGIRRECSGGDMLPPMELHEIEGAHPTSLSMHLCFSQSERHALTRFLTLQFEISVLDDASRIVKIEAAAALLASRPNFRTFKAPKHITLFESVFQKEIAVEAVNAFLLEAVDRAQAICQKPAPAEASPEPIWVTT